MRLVSIFLLSTMLFGCGTEGVDMEIDGVDSWFRKNETEVTSIVELFKTDKCLRRIELGSMKYISQNCETTPSQEIKIQNIQSKLSKLGVVLATSHFFDDGNFVSSILINRRGIAVSGGGLRISYWENFPSHRKGDIECGAFIHLSKKKWYAEILSSEEQQGNKVLDESLLKKDLTIPLPPSAQFWTAKDAKKLYKQNKLTDKEYGYIIAFIDLGLSKPKDNKN